MEQLESYLSQVKRIADIKHDPLTLQNALVPLIDQQTWAEGNPAYEQFFIAERLYYEGQYEGALRHYLAAQGIPLYQFFCYRATCQLLHSRGDIAQALVFAEKASKFNQEDPFIQALLQSDHKRSETSSSPEAPYQESHSEADRSDMHLLPSHKQTMEFSMNSGSDIFSSPTRTDTAAGESLTERLYTFNGQPPPQPSPSDQHRALHELRKLAVTEPRNGNIRSSIAPESDGGNALEERIIDFHKRHHEQMKAYLELAKGRSKMLDNSLCILNGWSQTISHQKDSVAASLPLTEESRKSRGGHYLRWGGKGIVINPGPGFIKNFHDHGLCVRDIDFVIVTRNSPEAYEDIRIISELNSQVNKTSPDLQIIHYYLHHKARQELATFLRPSFKQARHTIHPLEMFLDSPDVEKIELDSGITLHYFMPTSLDALGNARSHDTSPRSTSSLGIKLELSTEEKAIHVGYISGMGWSPLIAHHLGHCDVLLAGFGNTDPRDYSKLAYNNDSLGYHGCYSLLEEAAPKLMLLTEFGGRDGDIRLEVIKKIRQDLRASSNAASNAGRTVLPGDIGLTIDLGTLEAKCSMSGKEIPSSEVRVVASDPDFGRLNYLSPCYCI